MDTEIRAEGLQLVLSDAAKVLEQSTLKTATVQAGALRAVARVIPAPGTLVLKPDVRAWGALPELIRRLEEKYRLGVQMANLCYNVAQHDGIRPDVRESMAKLHQAWDALGGPLLPGLLAELDAQRRRADEAEARGQQLQSEKDSLTAVYAEVAQEAERLRAQVAALEAEMLGWATGLEQRARMAEQRAADAEERMRLLAMAGANLSAHVDLVEERYGWAPAPEQCQGRMMVGKLGPNPLPAGERFVYACPCCPAYFERTTLFEERLPPHPPAKLATLHGVGEVSAPMEGGKP